jgi:TIR domain-containing protein
MTAAADPKVFISYRREETAGHAGRLYDAVEAHLGLDKVFMDVEMAPGIDFVERISSAVGACRALVVVIGPRWAQPLDGRATARIADPDDFVRLEVETALRNPEVTVFPVLVGGARMPDPDVLPESLRPLARRNALELSDLRWRYDVGRLLDALDDVLVAATGAGTTPRGRERPQRPDPSRPSRARSLLPLFAEGVLVAAAAGMLGRALAGWVDDHTTTGAIAATILRRTVTWAVVAAALGGWLTLRRGEPRQVAWRTLAGLALGALAGALGGVLYELPQIVNESVSLSAADQGRLAVGSLAATGGLLGFAIGALWIPPRRFVGLLGGAVGGVLVQVVMNGSGTPADVLAVGVQCLVIVGLTLAALLSLDVRAASAVAPVPRAAPQPAADR